MADKSPVKVGDGMNDLPALSTARFSFGVPADAQAIDMLHADAVLLPGANMSFDDSLGRIAKIISLARFATFKVRQNMIWAIGYNIVAITLSAGVLEKFGFSSTPYGNYWLMIKRVH